MYVLKNVSWIVMTLDWYDDMPFALVTAATALLCFDITIIYMVLYTYIYIYIYIHTHTHTHALSLRFTM